MKNLKTNWLLKHTVTVFSCVLIVVLGIAFLSHADPVTTTIGENISTNSLTATGLTVNGATSMTADLTIQEAGDAKITVYSNTDSPTADSKLFVVQKGTTPSELFSVDEDGDVVIAGDFTVSGGELYLNGVASSSSTTEGTMYYDTDDDHLKVYANGKWQSDRSTATIIVGTSNLSGASLNYEKADYVCDGTDDHIEIQAAIDALPANGGSVFLLEGIYLIDADEINIDKSLCLLSHGTAILQLVNSTSGSNIIQISSDGVEITNIIIDGNHTGSGEGGNSTPKGIYSTGYDDININNCEIKNVRGQAINILSSSQISITTNHVHDCGEGILVETSEYGIISNNIVCDIGTASETTQDGIETSRSSHIIISNNSIYNISGSGIDIFYNSHYNTITGNNVFTYAVDSLQSGISIEGYTGTCDNNIVSNNIVRTGAGTGIRIQKGSHCIIADNVIENATDVNNGLGIRIQNTSVYTNINGNVVTNCAAGGILVEADNAIVVGNVMDGNGKWPLKVDSNSNALVKDNIINSAGWGVNVDHVEAWNRNLDILMDVLVVSATHIRNNEDLSASIPITFTLDAQPDIPRTLSWSFDTHAQITEYDMEVIGIDAKGNTVTETWDETAGWSGETNNAFATITSIKITSRTGTGVADTMDIGITDVFGLSNTIDATSDVFKIKKNNANATVAGAQVNTTYDTYDMSVIGLGAGDDFTIWYKSNLNIIN